MDRDCSFYQLRRTINVRLHLVQFFYLQTIFGNYFYDSTRASHTADSSFGVVLFLSTNARNTRTNRRRDKRITFSILWCPCNNDGKAFSFWPLNRDKIRGWISMLYPGPPLQLCVNIDVNVSRLLPTLLRQTSR
ncbi:hypothetical protein Trydic_g14192 [Trypoxylus dichotomus]